MRIAVFPGSFDPITKGHLDIVLRAIPLFDKIIVAMGVNSAKKYFFSFEKRLEFLNATFADYPTVEVKTYSKLTADFCREHNVKFILRGLRNANDFTYENTISHLNKAIGDDLESVFLMSNPAYGFYSSTIVREIIKGEGDALQFLPKAVVEIFEK